jgi:hypothetical protein
MLTLADVKSSLRISHFDDDALLSRLMDAAARECAQYLYGSVPDYTALDAPVDPLTIDDAANGIILVVQGDYDADPVARNDYRAVAITLWLPYRTDWSI